MFEVDGTEQFFIEIEAYFQEISEKVICKYLS